MNVNQFEFFEVEFNTLKLDSKFLNNENYVILQTNWFFFFKQ